MSRPQIRGSRRPHDVAVYWRLQQLIGMNTPTLSPLATIDNWVTLDGTNKPFELTPSTRRWITEMGGLKMVSLNGYEGTFTADEVEVIYGISVISDYAITKRGLVADGEDQLLCEQLEHLESLRDDRIYWFLD